MKSVKSADENELAAIEGHPNAQVVLHPGRNALSEILAHGGDQRRDI